jgi:hypothetical protein
MKDQTDQVTADLIPTPKKRGRPATGQALSAAARKRKQRERIDSMVWSIPENGGKEPAEMPITALVEGIAQAVGAGAPGVARALADELVRRAQLKDKQIKKR